MSLIDFLPLPTESRAALKVLRDEFGSCRAILFGVRIRKREKAGEPFSTLPPPGNEKEALSREQIGPAINLYRELQADHSQEEALRIIGDVVVQSTLVFLRKTIGPIRRSNLAGMNERERDEWVRKTGGRFFNAEMDWKRIDGDRVEFDVTACHFPGLCREAGVPELARVFCQGDAVFFGQVEPEVNFRREGTIAEGASRCEFRMGWVKPGKDR